MYISSMASSRVGVTLAESVSEEGCVDANGGLRIPYFVVVAVQLGG